MTNERYPAPEHNPARRLAAWAVVVFWVLAAAAVGANWALHQADAPEMTCEEIGTAGLDITVGGWTRGEYDADGVLPAADEDELERLRQLAEEQDCSVDAMFPTEETVERLMGEMADQLDALGEEVR